MTSPQAGSSAKASARPGATPAILPLRPARPLTQSFRGSMTTSRPRKNRLAASTSSELGRAPGAGGGGSGKTRLAAEVCLTLAAGGWDSGIADFDFAWVLADGTPAPFTVVDIAELTEDGLIANLHIIYDTSPIRGDFEQATRNRKP
jgi:hypothetical protein